MEARDVIGVPATYHVIRHIPSLARGEPRNVAIALLDATGGFARIKHLPPSQISPSLRSQGLFDRALVSLGRVIAEDPALASDRLQALSSAHSSSLSVSPGMPADASSGFAQTLESLYKALVAQQRARRPGIDRAEVLDRTINAIRHWGTPVTRGEYVDDFLIDAVASPRGQRPTILHAQSFATRRDWTRVERETGYFLLAARSLRVPSVCVLQEPLSEGDQDAVSSYLRVQRLIARNNVELVAPSDVELIAKGFTPQEQLPLVMA